MECLIVTSNLVKLKLYVKDYDIREHSTITLSPKMKNENYIIRGQNVIYKSKAKISEDKGNI